MHITVPAIYVHVDILSLNHRGRRNSSCLCTCAYASNRAHDISIHVDILSLTTETIKVIEALNVSVRVHTHRIVPTTYVHVDILSLTIGVDEALNILY